MSALPDEHAFAQLCATVIGVPEVAPTDHFFEVGGDSLSAARLAVYVDEKWQLNLDVFDIMTAASIREIYARMTGAERVSGG
jgi:acyl carrier protein